MSSNTIQRIISALVLMGALIGCLAAGAAWTKAYLFVFGIIVVDEIVCNFFKRKRFSVEYIIAELLLIIPYTLLSYIYPSTNLMNSSIHAAVALNALLIIYLFYIKMDSKIISFIGEKAPILAGPFILLPLLSLSWLFLSPIWWKLFVVLFFINFGMDTGAWFFGKRFGKRKLWEKVSPKKTIEGLFGGIFTGGALGAGAWHFLVESLSIKIFILFCLLGLLSQIGDLIQSKIKRQVGVKDSSALIPGHGGVYDRIDSLLFLAPFFSIVLRYYYLK